MEQGEAQLKRAGRGSVAHIAHLLDKKKNQNIVLRNNKTLRTRMPSAK
jgi:hypothetical protein